MKMKDIRVKFEQKTGHETVFALIPDLWEDEKAFSEEYVEYLENRIDDLENILQTKKHYLQRIDLHRAYKAGYERHHYLSEVENGGSEYWNEEPKEFNEWYKKNK